MIGWQEIAFQMSPELAEDVRNAWEWLLAEPWEPVLCSKVGGVFVKAPNGEVLWLDTATALVESAAASVEEFHDICRNKPDVVDQWFLPGLVERLHEAGKIEGPAECYAFTILPIFAEGKFVPDNMFVAPIGEVFVGLADVHKRLAELPDGSKVQIKTVD